MKVSVRGASLLSFCFLASGCGVFGKSGGDGSDDPLLSYTVLPSEAAQETEALANLTGVPPEEGRRAGELALYVVKMATDEFPTKYTDAIVSFQGLVNRGKRARLYLIRDEDSDRFWLEEIKKAGIFTSVKRIGSLKELFEVPEFASVRKRMVVYSDTRRDSKIGFNNVVMTAALMDAVIVDQEIRGKFKELGFKEVANLVGRWRAPENPTPEQRNRNELRAFRYGREVLQPRMTKGLLGVSPGGFGRAKGLDFYIKHRYFIMHLDAKQTSVQGHLKEQEEILDGYPRGTVAFGTWTNEVPDVRLLNAHGHTRLGDGYNVTVHESIQYPTPPAVRTREGRNLDDGSNRDVYIYTSFTQGDALSFCAKDNLANLQARLDGSYSRDLADKLFKAEYNFGLQHTPLQWAFQRLVFQGMHGLATGKQEFMVKPFGYSKATTLEKHGFLDIHLAKGEKLLERTGLRDIFLNDANLYENPSVVDKYVRVLKPRSVFTKHSIFEKRCINREASFVKGVPFFTDPIVVKTESKDPAERNREREKGADAVLESAKHRRFFWVFIDHTGNANDFAALQEIVKSRNPRVKFVNMSDFIATFKASPEASHPVDEDSFECIPETNPLALAEEEGD